MRGEAKRTGSETGGNDSKGTALMFSGAFLIGRKKGFLYVLGFLHGDISIDIYFLCAFLLSFELTLPVH